MKVSVVVPVYCIEAYLPRCLESLLAQTHKDMEIVAVDDGSPDGCGAILDRYAARDSRLVVLHQKNGGVTKARLAGIAAATGDWVGFVDGDDSVEPEMFARLLDNALRYGADISHCGYRMDFSDGRVSWFYNTGTLLCQDRMAGLQELLAGTLVEPGLWNKLYHRDLLRGLELDSDIRINEDLLMNYILFSKAEKSVFEDFCPYHYMIRGNSATHAPLNAHRIYDRIRVRERMLELGVPGMEAQVRWSYIGTCVNVYNSLMLDRTGAFRSDERKVRAMLCSHARWIPLLSKKQQLLARLIQWMPGCYRYFYRFYAAYLLKDPYV